MLLLGVVACRAGPVVLPPAGVGATSSPAPDPPVEVTEVVDWGLTSGYQDRYFGSWKRGRGASALDFDLDGRWDVATFNASDYSFLLRNVTEPGGPLLFESGQILGLPEDLLWAPGVGDFDNDGDPDLFAAAGGFDGPAADRLYRNDLEPDGRNARAPYTDVTQQVDVLRRGPDGAPLDDGSTQAIWFDFDNDGLLDLFTSQHVEERLVDHPEGFSGRNALWRQGRDGTFVDMTADVGMDTVRATRGSAVLDYDRDGDLDLYENNFVGGNVLWRNRLVEDGVARFEDATATASLGGGDLSFPKRRGPMGAIPADVNNDGWEDLVVFRRGVKDEDEPAVHDDGHLLWINVGGLGFVEAAAYSNLNDGFVFRDHQGVGVMGHQVGDVDGDGFPDLFMGNGAADGGEVNQLFVSAGLELADLPGVGPVAVPQYEDWSDLIDFPAPVPEGDPEPPYPERTHATLLVDFDGDGLLELAVHNGGPAALSDAVREPSRLYRFTLEPRPRVLTVRLVGDERVTLDAYGARVRVRVRDPDGTERDLYQVKHTATGFSSQGSPDLTFGLGAAVEVVEVEVEWPDGRVDGTEVDVDDDLLVIAR